jgi:hypothetical protein
VWKYSVALGISDGRMKRILRVDINLNPCKMMVVVVRELSDRDMANCNKVAERLIRILFNDVIILKTDEGHFHLSGCVNKQNSRSWAEQNSH